MLRSTSLSWHPCAPSASVRERAAAGLRAASLVLAQLARALAQPVRRAPPSEPRLEFYGEAGAPEGALYVDGQLVGWVRGVTRL